MKRLLWIVFAGVLLLPAQDSQPPTPFKTTVNIVVAPTTVTDRDGNFIHGLQPQDFRLYDNESLQNIKVETSYIPISLVVAIQANAGAEPVLDKIKTIGPIIEGLLAGEQGEVAVLAFDHRLRMMQDFTNDGAKVTAAIKKINAGSTTSRVVDAIGESVRMLRRRPADRRRVILLIAETRDGGSEGHVREVMTEAQINNIQAYTVNINRVVTTLYGRAQAPRPDAIPTTARTLPPGAAVTPTTVAAYGGSGMYGNYIPMFVEIFKQVKGIFVANPAEVLTRYTGGKEFSFSSQRGLEEALTKIGTDLHAQYIISYSPNNKLEGGFHTIRVVITADARAKVRTRPGYWMAAVPD
jgi:VWFA-related protein